MKLPFLITLFSSALFFAGCNTTVPEDGVGSVSPQVNIASYILLDAKALNEKLARIQATKNNLLIATLNIFAIDSDQKELAVYQVFPNIEDRTSVTITVIRSGYPDDSIRGQWNQMHLTTTADGEWTITKAMQAFSCWRSDSASYQKDPCP